MVYKFVSLPIGLSLAPCVFSRCIEAALKGSQNICSSGRLSNGITGHRDTHISSHESGIQNQLRQKPADSISGARVSGFTNRLCGIPRYALGEEGNGKCLAQFRRGNLVSFRTYLCLMAMMAMSLSVVLLGLLKMSELPPGCENYIIAEWAVVRVECARPHCAWRCAQHFL